MSELGWKYRIVTAHIVDAPSCLRDMSWSSDACAWAGLGSECASVRALRMASPTRARLMVRGWHDCWSRFSR